MIEAILVLGGAVAGAAVPYMLLFIDGVLQGRRDEATRASRERIERLKRAGAPAMVENAVRAMRDAAKAEARAKRAEAQLIDAWAEIDQLNIRLKYEYVARVEAHKPGWIIRYRPAGGCHAVEHGCIRTGARPPHIDCTHCGNRVTVKGEKLEEA